ncbi:MAG: hypothetical protein Q7R86_02135, partial [bacterium]|nr:hypothetical protein [bacterium]
PKPKAPVIIEAPVIVKAHIEPAPQPEPLVVVEPPVVIESPIEPTPQPETPVIIEVPVEPAPQPKAPIIVEVPVEPAPQPKAPVIAEAPSSITLPLLTKENGHGGILFDAAASKEAWIKLGFAVTSHFTPEGKRFYLVKDVHGNEFIVTIPSSLGEQTTVEAKRK